MSCRDNWIFRRVNNSIKDKFGSEKVKKNWTDKNGTKVFKEKGLKLPKIC